MDVSSDFASGNLSYSLICCSKTAIETRRCNSKFINKRIFNLLAPEFYI